jgi:hypothetical protein
LNNFDTAIFEEIFDFTLHVSFEVVPIRILLHGSIMENVRIVLGTTSNERKSSKFVVGW